MIHDDDEENDGADTLSGAIRGNADGDGPACQTTDVSNAGLSSGSSINQIHVLAAQDTAQVLSVEAHFYMCYVECKQSLHMLQTS